MRAFFYLMFFSFATPVMGTHLLGGYLSYKITGNGQVEVTVNLLTETNAIEGGHGTLEFGDGNIHQGVRNFSVIPLGFNVDLVSFSASHAYAAPGVYEISYSEPNYSAGINNMEGSGDIAFYISSSLIIDASIGENSSPILTLFQEQRGASGIQQRINPAPFDPDGDSLSFSLIVPSRDKSARIASYSYPNDTTFYKDYLKGNEAGDGEPVYAVNAATGEILWDAPELLGDYVFAYKIDQWRKIGGEWSKIGSMKVVMITSIFDAGPKVIIEAPASQCYETPEQIGTRFLLTATGNEAITAKVFTDLPEGSINGIPFGGKEYIEFTFSGELALDLTLPKDLNLDPFKLYRIIVQAETEPVVQSSSWAFAIGCSDLPGYVLPDPIVSPEEPAVGFLVYPNPTFHGLIHVRIPENKDKPRQIRIIDMRGQVLYNRQGYFSERVLDFDVSRLSAGVYILQADDYLQKFIVGD